MSTLLGTVNSNSLGAGVGQLVNLGVRSLLGAKPFAGTLQKASFAGVPFGVTVSHGKFGRKTAQHDYPFRDTPWIEDMGRAPRAMEVTGFLVSNSQVYGGGDVIAQRARLIAAAEAPGQATLVHPTLGRMTVSLVEGGLEVTERWDAGRYFEITLRFIESGKLQFPTVATSTKTLVQKAADALKSAASLDFSSAMTPLLSQGQSIVDQVKATAGGFGTQITGAVSDATSSFNLLGQLPGNFGAFAGGANLNVLGSSLSGAVSGAVPALQSAIPQTVQSLESTAAAARQAVGGAVGGMNLAAFGI